MFSVYPCFACCHSPKPTLSVPDILALPPAIEVYAHRRRRFVSSIFCVIYQKNPILSIHALSESVRMAHLVHSDLWDSRSSILQPSWNIMSFCTLIVHANGPYIAVIDHTFDVARIIVNIWYGRQSTKRRYFHGPSEVIRGTNTSMYRAWCRFFRVRLVLALSTRKRSFHVRGYRTAVLTMYRYGA